MARIKLGPMVTDIAGSIGGLTIQRNRFGITARQKPLPLYSETPAQYIIRQKILSLQYSWQNLSDSERLQWDRFIDFSGATTRRNRSVLLSGQGLYLKYQLFRLLYNQALLTTIVYSPMPAVGYLENLYLFGGQLYLNFSAMDYTKWYFVCKLSMPRSPAMAYSAKGLRFMKCSWDNAGVKYVTDPYVAAFGALPSIADVIHYNIRYFSVVSPVYSGVFTGILNVVLPP